MHRIHYGIFSVLLGYNTFYSMEKQYCKVGAVTPIITGKQSLLALELRYRIFLEKAARLAADTRLGEFFKRKAEQLKRVLDGLA